MLNQPAVKFPRPFVAVTLDAAPGLVALPNALGHTTPEGAEAFEQTFQHLLKRAHAAEGVKAFTANRSHAATHEAGHAVIGTLEGAVIAAVKVWEKQVCGYRIWGGRTLHPGYDLCNISPATSAASDFVALRMTLAGVIAEVEFVPDIRRGSSLDEVSTAQLIAGTLAAKMRMPEYGNMIFIAAAMSVSSDLRANERAVKAVASGLMHNKVLRSSRLQKLLTGLQRKAPPIGDVLREMGQ